MQTLMSREALSRRTLLKALGAGSAAAAGALTGCAGPTGGPPPGAVTLGLNRSLVSLDNPQAYLMQAVLNRARSSHQRFSRERETLSRVAPANSMSEAGYNLVVGDEVLRTVAELPMQQRAAIYLVYWEDLEPVEAAELMGVRPGTLRRYLHLARKKLRRYLDE